MIRIMGKRYYAHRLAWFYVHGEWPERDLDHEAGNTDDNRIEKIRPASYSQNGMNRKRRSNNRSGFKGVSWHEKKQKWVARIHVEGKQIFLGYFERVEEAAAAYKTAAVKYHGEFARFE